MHLDANFGFAVSCTNAINSNSRFGHGDKQQNAHASRSKQLRASSDSQTLIRPLSLQENLTAHSTNILRDPAVYSKTSDVMATGKSDLESSQPGANPNFVVCYNFGNPMCISESKPRRCFACSGFGHIYQNCLSHQSQQPQQIQSQSQKPNQKLSNAVESANVDAPQFDTEAIIDTVHVREALAQLSRC